MKIYDYIRYTIYVDIYTRTVIDIQYIRNELFIQFNTIVFISIYTI